MPTTDYRVTGMTCEHCVNAVRGELARLAGVRAVEVDLVPSGVSAVRIDSDREVGTEEVRAALDEAGGYGLSEP